MGGGRTLRSIHMKGKAVNALFYLMSALGHRIGLKAEPAVWLLWKWTNVLYLVVVLLEASALALNGSRRDNEESSVFVSNTDRQIGS